MNYKELSAKAQQVAFENWQPFTDYDWWDTIYEDWTNLLEERGITNAKIQFSGFHSQGDGASFTGMIDLRTLMEWQHKVIQASNKEAGETRSTCTTSSLIDYYPAIYISQLGFNKDEYAEFNFELKRSNIPYSHSNTIYLDHVFECSDGDLEDELLACGSGSSDVELGGIEQDLEELCQDMMKDIYKDLENQYDYLCSKEAFIEDCDNHDFIFDADGEIHDDYDDAILLKVAA